jgi:hypothetical protein
MLEAMENNEVILMMFLAGELPPVDRQEVSQMLASDAMLRGELERLRKIQASLEQELAALDRSEPIAPVDIAVRRVGRAMRQRQVDLASQAARDRKPAAERAGMPFWVYPSALAAAILVAFLIWVMRYNVQDHTIRYASPNPNPSSSRYAEGDQNTDPSIAPNVPDPKSRELADDIRNSFGSATESDDNQMFALRDDPQIAVGSNVSE